MDAPDALAHWPLDAPLAPAPEGGLINRTWLVDEPPRAVLQWVNPIFDPRIHLDLDAVTRRLETRGVVTPRLLPTRDERLWVDDDAEGCWRLLTYVPGRTLHRLETADQAAAAGELVGRFHAALAGWSYVFQGPRRPFHDTAAHMRALEQARAEAGDHPLAAETRALGAEILADWARWDGALDGRARPCHGDLKISNLRFDDAGRRARCLVDLDTLGRMPYACEMGDAWRSWCNPAGEDDPDSVVFDLARFAASARAWLAAAPALDADERAALVPGIERICLELAARFCTDAVRNVYFREDRARHPRPGAHNLLRARGQLALARSARAARAECAAIVRTA